MEQMIEDMRQLLAEAGMMLGERLMRDEAGDPLPDEKELLIKIDKMLQSTSQFVKD